MIAIGVDRRLQTILQQNGCEVLNKGWPDLLVVKSGKMILVEVKGPKDKLSFWQVIMHNMLRNHGFKVVVAHTDEKGNILSVEGSVVEEGCEDLLNDILTPSASEQNSMPNNFRTRAVSIQVPPETQCSICGGGKEAKEKVCEECLELIGMLGFVDKNRT
jgi:hypothetical protein